MKSIEAKFITSSPNLALCPTLNIKEFALLGRSNVGKSSFINSISNNNKLAKTSNTPGKTRLINLFNFSDKFIIADLPGYGYAKVSKSEQENWQKNLENYLLNRKNLVCCIQFIDARHEIQKNDFQMQDWISLNNLNNFTILTKCDYVSKNEIMKKISNIEKYFKTQVFPFSSKNNFYNDNILSHLINYN